MTFLLVFLEEGLIFSMYLGKVVTQILLTTRWLSMCRKVLFTPLVQESLICTFLHCMSYNELNRFFCVCCSRLNVQVLWGEQEFCVVVVWAFLFALVFVACLFLTG